MNDLRRSSQTLDAYERLRALLLGGRLAAGSRLAEEKWSAELGAHRGAIREAMRLLAHDGLLKSGAKGGFFVPEVDVASLDEVIEVRLSMELGAIQLLELSGRVSPRGIDRLDQVSGMMEMLCDEGFTAGFSEADHRFHEVLVGMAENSRLATIYRHAPLPNSPFPEVDRQESTRMMRETIDEHRAITRRLEEREFREAASILKSHLLRCHSGMFRAGPADPCSRTDAVTPVSGAPPAEH